MGVRGLYWPVESGTLEPIFNNDGPNGSLQGLDGYLLCFGIFQLSIPERSNSLQQTKHSQHQQMSSSIC